MATQRDKLGTLVPSGTDTFEQLFKCPDQREATVKVGVVNRETSATPTVRIAWTDGFGAPIDEDMLEYDTQLEAKLNGSRVFLWTATMKPGQKLLARSNSMNVTFFASGVLHDSLLRLITTTTTEAPTTTTVSPTTTTTAAPTTTTSA